MKFDKNLLRTVLFAVGVVAVVIGIYQTLLFNDLAANYWIFMVGHAPAGCHCCTGGSRSAWPRKLQSRKPSWRSRREPKRQPNRPRNGAKQPLQP